jgi:Flp pilus assembly protein TadG
MASKTNIFKRFCRNDRGNVAMMFGLGLVPMLAASGVAIDYSRLSSAKTRLQSALDSGVLAAAKDPSTTTNAILLSKVTPFVTDNTIGTFTANPTVFIPSADPNRPVGPNDVAIVAEGCIELAFVFFTGTVSPCVSVRTDVTRPVQTYLEIALVLDNSGSMAGAKIDAAKTAAAQFATSLFAGVTNPEQVKMSVVPFTFTVNAGTGMNVNTNTNLDRNGASPIHWENLLPPATSPPVGVISRFSLFQQLGETWGGCFETRPGAFGMNDVAPTVVNPSTLLVPMFAPDEPGPRQTGTSPSSLNTTNVRRDLLNNRNLGSNNYVVSNSYLNDDGSNTLTYNGSGNETSATSSACLPASTSSLFSLPFSTSTSTGQDQNWLNRSRNNICRYNLAGTPGGTAVRKNVFTGAVGRGPNYACNAIPLLRLTNTSATALTKINDMRAEGGTNILEGFMWGWRAISPNAPYADGRAYNWDGGQIRNKKIVVLMTDGDNTWNQLTNPNGSLYSTFGYYRNNRIGTGITTNAQATAAMNNATRQACTNAKATRNIRNEEGVQIYTVGFSTPGAEISTDGLQLLQDCASVENGRQLYYPASNAAELAAVFSTIANNIGRLKITN